MVVVELGVCLFIQVYLQRHKLIQSLLAVEVPQVLGTTVVRKAQIQLVLAIQLSVAVTDRAVILLLLVVLVVLVVE